MDSRNSEWIKVRLSARDSAALREAARSARLSVSAFVRVTLFDSPQLKRLVRDSHRELISTETAA